MRGKTRRNDYVPTPGWRGSPRSDSRCQYFVTGETVNITNVTNVTNVTQVKNERFRTLHDDWHGGVKRGKRRKKRKDRRPKLFRHCSSLGLLDSDIESRMSDGERLKEGANVVSYCTRGLARSAVESFSGFSRCMKRACVCLADMASVFFK